MAELKRTQLSVTREKAVLVGVILPDSTADPRDPLGELASLASTAGAIIAGQVVQRRRTPDPGKYVGTGKAEEIADVAIEQKADVIIFDNDLSPGQIGALEKIINERANSPRGQGIKVLDRSELILDIFANRARSHEARLQVELAQMEYTYPRLTRMWGHLERIAGGAPAGIGTRGPGEQQLEIDRRLVRKRISDLKKAIIQVQGRKSREVQRRNRDHFTACLVGYTNAGKSTLFNTLTSAGTYADDKLFATLDTKTRAWKLESGTQVMLSDTVGFVRDLPHHLVASFKATLEEAVNADVLLHVLDISHPQAEHQHASVLQVLEEIGVGEKPQILLMNKADTEDGAEAASVWQALHPDGKIISALTGKGLDGMLEAVMRQVRGKQVDVTLEAEIANGQLLSFLKARTRIMNEQYNGTMVTVQALMGQQTLKDLQRNEQVYILSVRDVVDASRV